MGLFRHQTVLPIGVHLDGTTATLVQLAETGRRVEVHSLAQGTAECGEQDSPDVQDRAMAQLLRRLIGEHGFRGRNVVSCLGAQQLFVQNVRLPKLPPEEVRKVVQWEAEERLPYPAADAELRYLLAGEVRQDANVKQEVILLACHRGVIDRHLGVLQQAGLAPLAIDVEPCALLRGLGGSTAGERQACLLFGERTTGVVIAEGTQVLFLKYIPQGSGQLDQAVARHLETTQCEARRMRMVVSQARELTPDDDLHRSIAEAIRQPLETLCAEIELCLRYYKVTFRGQPLQGLRLAGSEGAEWLAEYFGERLGLPGGCIDPFSDLASAPGAAARQRAGRWGVALGLSLKRRSKKGQSGGATCGQRGLLGAAGSRTAEVSSRPSAGSGSGADGRSEG